MPAQETQTTDAEGRVTLPAVFAKATVVVEMLSPTEVRIRKTERAADASGAMPEERITLLSARDRERFIELIQKPPAANAALRKAIPRRRKDG